MIYIEKAEISDKIKIPKEKGDLEQQLKSEFIYSHEKDLFSTLSEDANFWYLPTGALSKLKISEITDKRNWAPVPNLFKLDSNLKSEQQEVVDKFFPGPISGIIQAKCGWGKCKPYFSRILTSKGSLTLQELKEEKNINEIKIINHKGSFNIKSFYHNGLEKYYTILTNQGHKINGTGKHPILCYNKEKVSIEYKRMDSITKEDIIIGIVGTNIFGVEKIDNPYLIGLLIGDGSLTIKNRIALSSGDIEIIDYFKKWAQSKQTINNLIEYKKENHSELHITDKTLYKEYVSNYNINCKSIHKKICKTLRSLEKIQIIELLQGLFDTDGSAYDNGKIEYSSSSEDLAYFVLEQLNNFGIIASLYKVKTTHNNHFRVFINSDYQCNKFYNLIGFRIKRKQIRQKLLQFTNPIREDIGIYPGLGNHLYYFYKNNKQLYRKGYSKYFNNYRKCEISINKLKQILELLNKNNIVYPEIYNILSNTYGLKIKDIDIKNPVLTYDIEVDDISHSFISEGVINHNTYTACSIIAKANVSTLIVVHTKLLFYQWQAELKNQINNATIGMIGDGLYSVGNITVAIYKSLKNYTAELKNEFSLMVVDEVHRCPAKLFSETVNSFAAKVKIGVSATPKRRDGQHLLLPDYFTNYLVIANDTDDKPVPRVEITQTDIPFNIRNPKREWARALTTLCSRDEYATLIANRANHDISNGRCILIPADRIILLDKLLKLIPGSVKLVGNTPEDTRKTILENLGATYKCVLTTTIFDEGISAHRLDTLYLTCPSSNLTRLEQRIGRIERDHIDKNYPLIRDFWLIGAIVMGQQGHRGRWYNMTRPAPQKEAYMVKEVVGIF